MTELAPGCPYCKSSSYGFCKSHIPADRIQEMGWRVNRGKSSYHESRKLMSLKDFMARKDSFSYRNFKNFQGEWVKRYNYQWLPFLTVAMPKAMQEPMSKHTVHSLSGTYEFEGVKCAGDKECFLFLNRGYYCTKHGNLS